MTRSNASARRSRGRLALAFALAAVLAAVFASNAFAGVSTISNGWVDNNGLYGPGHSLTRVYVHDYGQGLYACEDAMSLGGSWVYNAPCVDNTAVWTDLCGCRGRYGWNGAGKTGGYEYMTGHEDW
jgi:hypothetical protein